MRTPKTTLREDVKYWVIALLGARASDVMPYIDQKGFSECVDRLTDAYMETLLDDEDYNLEGLKLYIDAFLVVDDLGEPTYPLYATCGGSRYRIVSAVSDAASANYFVSLSSVTSGAKKGVFVTARGECESDDSYSLEEIYPF